MNFLNFTLTGSLFAEIWKTILGPMKVKWKTIFIIKETQHDEEEKIKKNKLSKLRRRKQCPYKK